MRRRQQLNCWCSDRLSQWPPGGVCRLRVDVEAATRFSTEVPGSNHPSEQGTGSVLRVAKPLVKHGKDGEAHVETDEIGEGERPHGMVHAAFHHGVDRLGCADA